MKNYLCFALVFGCFCSTYTQENEYFTAAVFEHKYIHSLTGDKAKEIVRKNLKLYEKAADVAATKGTDIIVFPEYGLHDYRHESRDDLEKYGEHIPDAYKDSQINPCEDKDNYTDRPALLSWSCMAKKHKMFVVGNIVDEQPCPSSEDVPQTCDDSNFDSCNRLPQNQHRIFNTIVAFDRDGTIIARYHKNHLYHENLNTPPSPEYVTFRTEFGVFGLFVCFDSVFGDSVHLVEKFGVDTVLFTTFWFDNILPLNAIEWQQSWALTNKVNLLAANGHLPGLATLGSGIYSKDHGALVYTYNPDSKSKLLVAQVPLQSKSQAPEGSPSSKVTVITETEVYDKQETGEDFPDQCYDKVVGPPQDNLTDYRCIKSQTENYVLEKLDDRKDKLKICHNGFCCSLKYEAETMDEDYYLAAFNGLNNDHEHFEWKEETCFLVRCDSLNDTPCVTFPPRAQTEFKYVELKAKFTAEHVYPTVSTSNNRLAPKTSWDGKREKNTVTLRYSNKSNDKLLKVALMGRVYRQDPEFIPVLKENCVKVQGPKSSHMLHDKD